MKPWWMRLLRYAPRHARGLSGIAVMLLLGIALEVLRPWPLKMIVDDVLKGKPLPEGVRWIGSLPGAQSANGLLAWLAGGTVLLFVAAQVISIVVMHLRSEVGGRMASELGADVLDRVQRIPPGKSRRATGDLVKRVTVDALAVKELILSVMLPLVMALITLGVMFAIMWRLDRGLALLALGAAVPMAVLIK